MSRLGQLESNIVARLAGRTYAGAPLYGTVRGASGGYRAELRELISRERLPAAYVAFLDEKAGGDEFGLAALPRFAILVADRTLRITSNPRTGDDEVRGCFTLIDQTRTALDGYAAATGAELDWQTLRFVDADERQAVYELIYRVEPPIGPVSLGGEPVGGAASAFRIAVGPVEAEVASFSFPGIDGEFRRLGATRGRTLHCRGRLRAADDEALSAIEAELDSQIAAATPKDFVDPQGRAYGEVVLERWSRVGYRTTVDVAGSLTVEQRCALVFRQLASERVSP